MAIQRLRDIERSDDPTWGEASRRKYMLHYDLEAFIWVTFYSILIYTINLSKKEKVSNKGASLGTREASDVVDNLDGVDDPSGQQTLQKQKDRTRVIEGLGNTFSYSTLKDVKQAKESFVLGGIDVLEFIEDETLRKVGVGAWELLYKQNLRLGDPELITHESLCKMLAGAGA